MNSKRNKDKRLEKKLESADTAVKNIQLSRMRSKEHV
jgi:hypothetical protein